MMIGKLYATVLDCPDPQALAEFYGKITGLQVTTNWPDWVTIGDDTTGRISFQQAPGHVPPRWPDPASSQQVHLDIEVDDLDTAEAAILALGATHLASDDEEGYRVYADPAGHPFCLVTHDEQS